MKPPRGPPPPPPRRPPPPPPGRAATAAAAKAPTTAPGAEDRVALYAVAVDRENIRPLLVEEGVEVDGEEVVGPVAVDAVCPHHRRVRVVCVETKVDIGAVVGDVDLGLFGRRRTIERLLLHELGDPRGVSPHSIVEPSVDRRRRVSACGSHGHTTGQRTGVARHTKPRPVVTQNNAAGNVLRCERRQLVAGCSSGRISAARSSRARRPHTLAGSPTQWGSPTQ